MFSKYWSQSFPQFSPLSATHPNLIDPAMTVVWLRQNPTILNQSVIHFCFFIIISFVYLGHISLFWGKKYLDALPCYPTSLISCPCRTIWTVFQACLTFSNTKLVESLIHSPPFLTMQQARTCSFRSWRVCASIKCSSRWINEQNTPLLNSQFPHRFRSYMTLFGWSSI